MAELREVEDGLRRSVIVGIWLLTVVIAVVVVRYVWNMGAAIIGAWS